MLSDLSVPWAVRSRCALTFLLCRARVLSVYCDLRCHATALYRAPYALVSHVYAYTVSRYCVLVVFAHTATGAVWPVSLDMCLLLLRVLLRTICVLFGGGGSGGDKPRACTCTLHALLCDTSVLTSRGALHAHRTHYSSHAESLSTRKAQLAHERVRAPC